MAGDPDTERVVLAKLDPNEVAVQVCQKVIDHLMVFKVEFLDTLKIESPRAEELAVGSDPGRTARLLTIAAQRGLPVGDWTHTGMLADAMNTMFTVLFSSADGPTAGGGLLDSPEVEAEDAMRVVLLACKCRIAIDQRGEVTPRELAAVAGCSTRTVQRDIVEGLLRPVKGTRPQRIPWEDAKAWLLQREVPGFVEGDDFLSRMERGEEPYPRPRERSPEEIAAALGITVKALRAAGWRPS
ncbi:helix-turn-helix domain-containing protein [Pendulispora rubella]|uniref:Helix-turn-helix domain-containing protein n=1 Tax=Pendulispora rubella TaxID=2741070 RepID=A0ABZ2KTL1_9BACT